MRIPEVPPDTLAEVFGAKPTQEALARMMRIIEVGIKAEINGRYLHWDELRHRTPPPKLTHIDWWAGVNFARNSLKSPLPLTAKDGRPFVFAQPASVQRLLHRIDRDVGGQLEVSDPQLANPELRDRYLIRSLMEEAITSSQLEGAATTRKVAKELLRSGRKPRTRDERMIVNNYRAMEFLRENRTEVLSAPFLLALHKLLTDGTLQAGEAGRLRRPDETVSVQSIGDGEVLHVPPDASELPDRIEALCDFANDESDATFVHPIARSIVLHFALAYDHPFVDGNGRTARALFYWSMLRHDYWLVDFLSISRIIQKAPSQYGRAFLYTETDAGDLTYFLVHQLGVLQQATQDLYTYLQQQSRELKATEQLLKDGHLNYRQRTLLAHALRHPNARYTIAAHEREYGVVYQTARQDLLDLVDDGYLERDTRGRAFHFQPVPNLEEVLKTSAQRRRAKAIPAPRR